MQPKLGQEALRTHAVVRLVSAHRALKPNHQSSDRYKDRQLAEQRQTIVNPALDLTDLSADI